MKVWVVWISYLGVLSLLALILYGADKAKAKANAWRISEKTLLGAGFFGGSVGALLGMKLFRHKTKHWYFRVFFPLLLILQARILGYLWSRGIL
jgi:uncharacterized membrane protein YsdA (DUF1294 family)